MSTSSTNVHTRQTHALHKAGHSSIAFMSVERLCFGNFGVLSLTYYPVSAGEEIKQETWALGVLEGEQLVPLKTENSSSLHHGNTVSFSIY